jgi:hypothetical protein
MFVSEQHLLDTDMKVTRAYGLLSSLKHVVAPGAGDIAARGAALCHQRGCVILLELVSARTSLLGFASDTRRSLTCFYTFNSTALS